ncbi:MAG: hypothetical protein ACO1O1_10155 [Adhaeribacter sp.]
MEQGRRGRILLLWAWLVLVGTGCRQGADFQAAIGAFEQSTETAATAIKTYYQELNQYERELYLQERLLHDSLRVAIRDRQGRPTPLLFEPFDPAAIQGRVDLLQQVALYGQQLAALAGNQAPEQTQKNLGTLAANLQQLHTTFSTLSRNQDAEAGKYLGPIGTLLGLAGKPLLEQKRTRALRQAIREGEQPVEAILSFLEQDLRKYVETTRLTGQQLEMAEWVNYYNRRIGKLTFAQRQQMLNLIKKAATDLQLEKRSQPASVVTSLRMAHLALVKYAASSGRPTDLGTLASALKSYEQEARQLVETVAELQKINREN